jgi:hypothetical protein
MGVMVPRGPLSHAPTEGRGQRLLEGGHRQVGTPGARPATRACARPSGRFSSSRMLSPPLPLRLFVVDLRSHHSMKRQRLATSRRMARAACAGELAWRWGAASGQARVLGHISVWVPFQYTKEPYR